jgi:serine/threonine protein kinase
VEILAPVCDVLAEAHASGLVHRDIKLDNVFLHRTPRGEVVKLLDFGIAKLVEAAQSAHHETTRGVIGTPSYLAPERVMGLEYDQRADIYSMGVLMYEVLAGHLPFLEADDGTYDALVRLVTKPIPPLAVEGVPRGAESLVRRALAKDPEERPSAAELRDELRRLSP